MSRAYPVPRTWDLSAPPRPEGGGLRPYPVPPNLGPIGPTTTGRSWPTALPSAPQPLCNPIYGFEKDAEEGVVFAITGSPAFEEVDLEEV